MFLEYQPTHAQRPYPIEQVISSNSTYNWTSIYFFNSSSSDNPPMPILQQTYSDTYIFGQDGNLSTLNLSVHGQEYYQVVDHFIFFYKFYVNGTLDPKMLPSNFTILYKTSVPAHSNGTGPTMFPEPTITYLHLNTSKNDWYGHTGNIQLYNDSINSSSPFHFSYEGQVNVDAFSLQKNETYSFTISAILNGLEKSVGSSVTIYINGR